MLVCGKQVKEWIDAPHGAFAKAVRESIDPKWGADAVAGDDKEWEVRVDYSYSGRGTTYITVRARSEEQAEELAMEEFDKDAGSLDFFDAEIDDAEVKSAKVIK